jgi:drug/metabolite transporter (DMT)-like permease
MIASMSFIIIDISRKFTKKQKLENDFMEINLKSKRKSWFLIVIASFTGVSLYMFFLYSAIEIIGPSIPSLYDSLVSPVIIAIFSIIFYQEKMNKLKTIGFILASIGSFLLITGGDFNTLKVENPSFIGYMLLLITPLLWASYSMIIRYLTKSYGFRSEFQILKFITYFGCLELFFFVLISNQLYVFIINFFNIVLLFCGIYLGAIGFVFGYYSWNYSQKRISATKAASFLYSIPFFTILFSLLLQRNEIIVIWNILGGILVLIAVIIINYEK